MAGLFNPKTKGIIFITLIFLITFLYMLPLRDQTFQDDWAYIQSVRYFSETGIFKISDWLAPSSIFPVSWAILFTELLGFSISNIHLSVIVLLYFSLMAFYYLLLLIYNDVNRAIVFTLALLGFPWVFQFAYTFISEVPYMSILILSLYFFSKGLKTKNNKYLVLGSICSGMAFLTRQLGLALIVSECIVLLYDGWINRKIYFKNLLSSLLPFALIYFAYSYWLSLPGNLTNPQYQIKSIFNKQVLPYLLPFDLGRIEATYGYYASYIQRIPFYFHHAIGFLLPLFLIFKFRVSFKGLLKYLKKYKLGIMCAFMIYSLSMLIEYYLHFDRKQYELEVPGLVTRYFNFLPINWLLSWKYFIIISVPIWIIIMGRALQDTYNTLFSINKNRNYRRFVLSILHLVLFIIFLQFAVFKKIFKSYVPTHIKISNYHKLLIYKDTIFSSTGMDVFRKSWLVLFVQTLLLIVVVFTLFYLRPKNKNFPREKMFIALTFIIQASLIIFLGYSYWAQYVISMIPFFVILFYWSTKDLSVSYFRASLMIILILVNSVSATKNRYSDYGIKFDLGTKLVKQGVQPLAIDPYDESWIPWWYYEATFEEAVLNDYGGNKYIIPPGQAAVWRERIKLNSEYVYSYTSVPMNFSKEDSSFDIVIDTGPVYYDFFRMKRYIAFKEKIK